MPNNSFWAVAIWGAMLPAAGTIAAGAPWWWGVGALFVNYLGLRYLQSLKGATVKMGLGAIIVIAWAVLNIAFFFSYVVRGTGFDAAVFYHMRPDILYAGLGDYALPILGVLIHLIVTVFWGYKVLTRHSSGRPGLGRIGWVALTFLMCVSPPVLSMTQYVYEGYWTHSYNSLTGQADPVSEFLHRSSRQNGVVNKAPGRKKNLVLVYAESLEQRYFDGVVFPDLLPGLTQLKKKSIDFTNISQAPRSSWTIGGIVASQCGLPLIAPFSAGGNNYDIFKRFMPNATCLGDILASQGYRLTFMGGADPRFAGKGNFLQSHGFSTVLGRGELAPTLEDPTYLNEWGLYDDSLLEKAYAKFESLAKTESPFVLSVLTLDTHHPNGHASSSCGDIFSNSMLNSVHCSDLLISEFVEKIRLSEFSSDTVIMVLSDHLAMKNVAQSKLQSSEKDPRLTFIVNMPEGNKVVNDNAGNTYDIPATILDLLSFEIEGGVGFGRSISKRDGLLHSEMQDSFPPEASLVSATEYVWDWQADLRGKEISVDLQLGQISLGSQVVNIFSEGNSRVPASAVLVFDKQTRRLANMTLFPFDRRLKPNQIPDLLASNKDHVVLAISRAYNLLGFASPKIPLGEWVVFLGKPGAKRVLSKSLEKRVRLSEGNVSSLFEEGLDLAVFSERERFSARALKYYFPAGGSGDRGGKG